MIQRWLWKRDKYVPPSTRIKPSEYDVVPIAGDNEARRFVEQHHYSGSYPAARERIGLYRFGELVGVAVFSVPMHEQVILSCIGGIGFNDAVELGRFVLRDEVPANGETWFLARCYALLREKAYKAVVGYSDPFPRTTAEGRTIFAGHIGTIYQASNAAYVGRSTNRTLKLLPDATVFNNRAHQKIRAGEVGWTSCVKKLTAFGADSISADADRPAREAWLALWLPRLTRSLKHPGNFKYVWLLNQASQLTQPQLPYPKRN
jgi:hypothetical protein